jgi:hypothetical protein
MVLSAAENNNVDLYDLVSKTISSYRYGQSRASVLRINLDKQYNDQYLLLIAERLSSFEISILLKASEVRERGLALARSGDVENGGKALNAAREIYVETNLSKEALITAESFQAPADAYLQYKRKEYGEACASLVAALKACQILRDEYGQNLVELRWLQLVRNIIRVESVAGNLSEAMRLASSLLRYIESGNEHWPFPELPLLTQPEPLALEEKLVVIDQILGEDIAPLLANPKDTAKQLLKVGESYLFQRDIDSQFARVHSWLAAMRASVEEDLVGFFNNAILFFSEGPNYLDQAWRKMVKHFVQVCMEVAPEVLLQDLAAPGNIAI